MRLKLILSLTLFLLVVYCAGAQSPVLSNVSPLSGLAGSTVNITGAGFDATPANNIVYFGGVKAAIKAASTTSLTVAVPTGATSRSISVLNLTNHLTGYYSPGFNSTFTSKNSFTAADLSPKIDFNGNYGPVGIVTGDVDGDGKPDIIVINFASSTVSVLRNTTTAGTLSSTSFAPKVEFATGNFPFAMYLEDLDGDGKLDIVTANRNDNSISILRNTATVGAITATSFVTKVDLAAGTSPGGITVADIDGDGKPDIAASNAASNNVSVYLNKAVSGSLTASSFAAKVDIAVDKGPSCITAADIDGDGKMDLITGNASAQTISILRNTSTTGIINSSSFATKFDFAAAEDPYAITTADLDADGKPDIIIAASNNNKVSLLRNISIAGYIGSTSLGPQINITVPGQPQSIAITDIDGDGGLDIVTSNNSGNGISLLRNLEKGGVTSSSFAAPVNITFTNPSSVAACDLDGDGKPDLITGNTQNVISVIHSDPVLPPPVITSFAPASGKVGSIVTITGTNFNADAASNIVYFGITKAVVNTATPTQLTVTVPLGSSYQPISVLNTESHRMAYSAAAFITTFNSRNKLTTSDFAPFVGVTYGETLATGDIDGDGKPDVLSRYGGGPGWQLVIKRNISTPGNVGAASFPIGIAIATSPVESAVLADVDGDGKLDVIYSLSDSYNPGLQLTILRNTSTPGNMRFDAPVIQYINEFTSVNTADIDGDGKTDLVTSYYGMVDVYRNTTVNGNISFGNAVHFTTNAGQSASLEIGDLDGDHKPDLVITSTGDYGFAILRNKSTTGNVAFDTALQITATNPANAIAIGDIDGDGKPDIVASSRAGAISIYQNKATPGSLSASSFGVKVSLALNSPDRYALALRLADVDGDSKPDIVFLNYTTNNPDEYLCFFKNNATIGTITAASMLPQVTLNTEFIVSGYLNICDLDGDGKPDILTTDYIFRNDPAVYSPPTITSVTPLSAVAGSTISIKGSNFESSITGNTVYFGAVKAVVQSSSPTQITVKLPVGATYAPVSVLNNISRLSVYSSMPFSPVFAGKQVITPSDLDVKVDYSGYNIAGIIAAGDLDGDGKPDLIGTIFNGDASSVLTNYATPGYFANSDYGSSFGRSFDIRTGKGPINAQLKDMDNDGRLDVVIVNQTDNTVSVVRNNNGNTGGTQSKTFLAKVDFPVGKGARYFAIADLDNDGKADIAVVNTTDNTVSVLRSTSAVDNFSFDAKIDLPCGTAPSGIALADIDGDGRLEMIVTNSGDNTVSVFRNTSSAENISFAAKVDFTTGPKPLSPVVGDMDNDGKPDIAVIEQTDNTVSVLRNTSTQGSIAASSFAGRVSFATGANPSALALGFINGDDKPELIVANTGNNNCSIFRNTSTSGSLSTASFAAKVDFATLDAPTTLIVADLDGDGLADIAVGTSGYSFSVLRNDPVTQPSVQAPVITTINPGYGNINTDITISGTNFGNGVSNNIVYFGAAKATIKAASASQLTVQIPGGNTYSPITVLNTTTHLSTKSALPFNTTFPSKNSIAPGDFDPRVDITVVPSGSDTNNIVFHDMDGDGKPDMIISSVNAKTISVYRNIGTSGSLSASSFAPKVDYAVSGAGRILVCDMDGDGKPDIITHVISNGFKISFLKNNSSPGNINSSSFVISTTVDQSNGVYNIEIGDIDGDGKPDLVVANNYDPQTYYYSTKVSLYANTSTPGSISFGKKGDIDAGLLVNSANLVDLDGDGKLDLAVVAGYNNQLYIYKNISIPGNVTTGAFALPFIIPTYGVGINIADIDGDSKPDIVFNTYTGLSLRRNVAVTGTLNAQSFAPKVDFTGNTSATTISDIDGDGKPDIVCANGYTNSGVNSYVVLRNTSSPGNIDARSFAPKIELPAISGLQPIAVADIDGDGKPDIAGISVFNGPSILSLYHNAPSNLPLPTITAITPAAAGKGETVTITGTNFTNVLSVSFGNVAPASFNVVSPTVITAILNTGATGDVAVVTKGGVATLPGFTFIQAPAITSYTPASGGINDVITITGTDFTGVTAVTFGGVAAKSFTLTSPTTITAVLGTGSTGNVVVTTNEGSGTAYNFAYLSTPVITSYTSFGTTGTNVNIGGNSFIGTTSVSIGGVPAQSFVVNSAFSITAVVGAGASGPISVTTKYGTGTSTGNFTFIPIPTITAASPTTFLTGGSVLLTASPGTGTGYTYRWFKDGTTIAFANAATYTATQSGVYTVQITMSNVSQVSAGTTVNVILQLPANNFTVATTSVTCKGANNGIITIAAVQNYNYTATLTGGSVNPVTQFTNSTTLGNLSPGTYNLCITITGQPGYQQCYTLVITEPKDLAVYSIINTDSRSVTLSLGGGDVYHVQLNGVLSTTTNSQLTLPLATGTNTLVVTTDKACQGVVEKTVVLSDKVLSYPVPFESYLNINLGYEKTAKAVVEMYNTNGRLVYQKQFDNPGAIIALDMSGVKNSGVYSVKLTTDRSQRLFKVYRK